MIDLTTVAQAALVLFGAVITTVIVPCVKKNTTVQQQKEIMGWVKIAVAAAEQLYKGSDRGEEKKAYVLDWLNKQGITILLVEQNAKMALAISDRAYVLETGTITLSGDAQELLNDARVKKAYLGQ